MSMNSAFSFGHMPIFFGAAFIVTEERSCCAAREKGEENHCVHVQVAFL